MEFRFSKFGIDVWVECGADHVATIARTLQDNIQLWNGFLRFRSALILRLCFWSFCRYEQHTGHPYSTNSRSSHMIGRLVNLIRVNFQ